jgi:putative membrane protein
MQLGIMYGYGYGMMGGGYWILRLIFWIIVLIGVVLLIKHLWKGSAKQGDSALEILKKRYAKGEINKEEFEEKKKELI